jgi:P-type Ca2+ transporter type 2C
MIENLTTASENTLLRELHAHDKGLSHEEAALRLKKYGHNRLPEEKGDSYLKIFVRQFKDPLIYVLLAAALIVFFLKEPRDSFIILFVLIFNAVIGTIQEGKAQNILAALKNLAQTTATVIRDGEEMIIPDTDIVPGDVVILQEGERVPADCRVIYSNNLKVDEAILTGESNAVFKVDEALEADNLPLAERKNMVFKGTLVVYGNARALVVGTALKTEIGKISKEISEIDTQMPLQANMEQMSKVLVAGVLGIAVVIFLLGIGFGNPLREMFITVVALCVSAIPAGLPVALTFVLAVGVNRMGKRNALVKRLQAVEGLGQVKVIAVDKTGTLTKNEMMVLKAYIGDKYYEVDGLGYEPKGNIYAINEDNGVIKKHHISKHSPEVLGAVTNLALCADAHVSLKTEKRQKQWCVTGDPTEAAILVFARKMDLHKDKLLEKNPIVRELPFDYKLKYKATLHKDGLLSVIGAPEVILNNSNLSEKEKERLTGIFDQMSAEGLRMVAFASKQKVKEEDLDNNHFPKLEFGGFIGMRDTLRPEAKKAVELAGSAGIKVVMITGDNRITAQAIASEVGIFKEGDEVLTGEELHKLSDKELSARLNNIAVFARVTPEDKLKIIRAYKANGIAIGMTGDGVNDAPSLVAADIGVSMGKIGTEVAKEASDIVLLDDNFKSIIAAVEEGRNVYKTIKKVISYLFSTNLAEILIIMMAILLGLPIPLLASQIIWLNFVTDGFLVIALAAEKKESKLLTEKFKMPGKYLVDASVISRVAVLAPVMCLGTLFSFVVYLGQGLEYARTMALVTLVIFQWFNAWNCRSEKKSILRKNPISNVYLILATVWVVALQILALNTESLRKILHLTDITASDWLFAILVASILIYAEEVRKYFLRQKKED